MSILTSKRLVAHAALVAATAGLLAACAADDTHDPSGPATPANDDGVPASAATPVAPDAFTAEDADDGVDEGALAESADDTAESREAFDVNDPDVEQVEGQVTQIRSIAAGIYKSDVEWHTSNGYKMKATITWYQQKTEEQAQLREMMSNIQAKLHDINRAVVSNLRGSIMLQTAGIVRGNQELLTWYASGWHTEKDGVWNLKRGGNSATRFPSLWFKKSDRPFVHFNVGKLGKKKMVFNVWPFEKG